MGWRGIIVAAAAAAALALAAGEGAHAQASGAGLLASMFQDHAVLQRDRPLPVWGKAAPGEAVTVEVAGKSARATAGADGRWRAELPPLAAGGPYALTARASGGAVQSVTDVLVGDVWLCSGQSNMQFQTKYSTNAYGEVNAANAPTIRLFQIETTASAAPLDEFDPKKPPHWEAATPASVADFSAACWFFGRDIQKTAKVPQGLIHASWGGSTIQTWLSEGALARLGYDAFMPALAQYRTDPAGAGRTWGKAFEAWWAKNEPGRGRPWRVDDSVGWTPAPADLGAWERWGEPKFASFDGLMWLRTTVDLTAAQARQPAVLKLGKVADGDITWINGEPVGSDRMWSAPREYRIRPGLLKAGRNTIVVGVFNAWSEGGLLSPRSEQVLQLGSAAAPLDRPWSYKAGPSGNSSIPFPPWDALFGVTMARNGMLAPIGPYGYRGVLWYQGESNTARPQDYAPLLKALIDELRKDQTGEVAFLDVQLASFGPHASQPVDTGWARVREAQRQVVKADPRAALAITYDIGDPTDVHPTQKVVLGARLARAARRVSYGEAIPPSGPVPVAVRRQGDKVAVEFGEVTGRLVSLSSDRVIGFELCRADGSGCAYADARLAGNTALLDVPSGLAPGLVRFCWADSPICNLYDGADLPAGPFEEPVP